MTNQELFDFVVSSVIKQGGPSVALTNGQIECLYRSPEGRKCAVGFLIPDDKYTPACESHLPRWLRRKGFIENISDYQLNMIDRLQYAHDEASAGEFIDTFLSLCKRTASAFYLEWKFEKTL